MRKIKLNPNRQQRETLNKFGDAARFTYNECVAAVNSKTLPANKMRLRNAFVTAKNNDDYFQDKQWLLETPKVIRQQAAFEAAKNFKAAWTNKARGNIDNFKMGFKSKRTRGYVIGIEKQLKFNAEQGLVILPESIGHIRYFEKPPIDKVPEAECRVQRDAFGDFWLLVPVKKAVKPPSPGVADDVVAIDPGIRTPFSCYSPSGHSSLEGIPMKEAIAGIQRRVARTDQRIAAATDKDLRVKLRLYRRRLFKKYQNIRDDAHWKTIQQMTEKYGTVLLPHLETSRLSGGLRAKSNREMFGISHYLFGQRMQQKCEEKSVTYVEANESYTSKTCGRCGFQHASLGSSERFSCPACGLRCHRDLHAARNIFLRWYCETQQVDDDTLGTPVPMAS